MMKSRVDKHDRIIGRNIKVRRLVLGKKQAQLGEAIGVSTQQIQKYEKGTNRVSCSSMVKIADYLKIPIMYFFECHDSKDESRRLINFAEQYGTNKYRISEYHVSERLIIKLSKNFSQIQNKQMQISITNLVENIAKINVDA